MMGFSYFNTMRREMVIVCRINWKVTLENRNDMIYGVFFDGDAQSTNGIYRVWSVAFKSKTINFNNNSNCAWMNQYGDWALHTIFFFRSFVRSLLIFFDSFPNDLKMLNVEMVFFPTKPSTQFAFHHLNIVTVITSLSLGVWWLVFIRSSHLWRARYAKMLNSHVIFTVMMKTFLRHAADGALFKIYIFSLIWNYQQIRK